MVVMQFILDEEVTPAIFGVKVFDALRELYVLREGESVGIILENGSVITHTVPVN